MKYTITYKNSEGDEEREVLDAKFVQVLNGNLHLLSDIAVDARVIAIFSSWIKIIEINEGE